MTPMMSLFLRCLLALLLVVVLLSLSDYAMAATPVETVHGALDAMGPQTSHLVELWRFFLIACTFVFVAILVAAVIALRRAPRAGHQTPADLSTVNAPESAVRRHVTRAVVASVLSLVALIVASVFTDRAMARLSLANAVSIEVTAHQWWWTARYMDGPNASDIFVTANEIHVPVGGPVIVQLRADDVIHSSGCPASRARRT